MELSKIQQIKEKAKLDPRKSSKVNGTDPVNPPNADHDRGTKDAVQAPKAEMPRRSQEAPVQKQEAEMPAPMHESEEEMQMQMQEAITLKQKQEAEAKVQTQEATALMQMQKQKPRCRCRRR
ncbi:MAG: uncharacterized protein A8A55_2468 [Amphiamblys sp. WSBS2006]|nr:MAG: uncharacterized protein A8A55_2468 [Amphiamblys sp. WSBS2006]